MVSFGFSRRHEKCPKNTPVIMISLGPRRDILAESPDEMGQVHRNEITMSEHDSLTIEVRNEYGEVLNSSGVTEEQVELMADTLEHIFVENTEEDMDHARSLDDVPRDDDMTIRTLANLLANLSDEKKYVCEDCGEEWIESEIDDDDVGPEEHEFRTDHKVDGL